MASRISEAVTGDSVKLKEMGLLKKTLGGLVEGGSSLAIFAGAEVKNLLSSFAIVRLEVW